MSRLCKTLLGVVSWMLVLGACGPVPEGEEFEAAEPAQEAVQEPETVSQMGICGDLGSRLGNNLVACSSCTASNQWRTTCGSGSSRDMTYVWRVPATGTYNFNTAGSNFDTVMEIRNYRATSEVMACDDDTGSNLHSSITLSGLIRGSLLFIIVEGYEGACGNIQININKR